MFNWLIETWIYYGHRTFGDFFSHIIYHCTFKMLLTSKIGEKQAQRGRVNQSYNFGGKNSSLRNLVKNLELKGKTPTSQFSDLYYRE